MTVNGACELLSIPSSNASDLALGSDGNVWYTAATEGRIGRVTTNGSVLEVQLRNGAYPIGITSGPDGNLWFTENSGNAIGRITPAGTVTEFPTSPNFLPVYIVAGSDGNLWFTGDGGRIGRITTSGVITEFLAPSPGRCMGITAGPDGHIWFSELSANKIVKVSLDPVVPTKATVKLGRLSDGNVASLASRDWDAFAVCKFIVPNQVVAPVNVEVEGTAPGTTLSELAFSLVSEMSSTGMFEAKLVMWNWDSNGWDATDVKVAKVTNSSAAIQVDGTNNLQRYLDPNRRLRARYAIRQTGPAAQAVWCHWADQAVWIFKQ